MLLISVWDHQVIYHCYGPPSYLIVLGATMLLTSVKGPQISDQC